ncbi:hypothetical protein RRG08_006830 [Elysia crispata]|uniref:Uncharacterized protein n=1 Tax=Elysia crispata TaxID=231223 RepID=A0AAE1CNI5_9GAST|nr:hypothetical protein RRG08_006830 [Elysia crispata]
MASRGASSVHERRVLTAKGELDEAGRRGLPASSQHSHVLWKAGRAIARPIDRKDFSCIGLKQVFIVDNSTLSSVLCLLLNSLCFQRAFKSPKHYIGWRMEHLNRETVVDKFQIDTDVAFPNSDDGHLYKRVLFHSASCINNGENEMNEMNAGFTAHIEGTEKGFLVYVHVYCTWHSP